jgi:putative transposase
VRFPRRCTATFRLLYVFVVIEHRSRRLIHCNVTAHPTAAWTLQQLRETVGLEGRYEYLRHDRDSIFATHLDESITRLGVKVLRTPPRSPRANAICERVIGTIRRECLDWLIPLSESHLRSILNSWIPHYNRARPHMALGPGVPDPPLSNLDHLHPNSRHRRGESYAVHANPILGGLHTSTSSRRPALVPIFADHNGRQISGIRCEDGTTQPLCQPNWRRSRAWPSDGLRIWAHDAVQSESASAWLRVSIRASIKSQNFGDSA